jgi:hypothetical protein
MRVFENRALRKIHRHKSEQLTEGLRRLRPSLFVCLTKYYFGDEFKENEMGRACGTGGKREMHKGCW